MTDEQLARVSEHPGVETIGAGGGPRDDPSIPCHGCGTEDLFSTMKRSDAWTLTYLEDGSGQWVAYCSNCSGGGQ